MSSEPYGVDGSLWEEQEKYLHHAKTFPDSGYKVMTTPLPVSELRDDSKTGIAKVVEKIKLHDLKYVLEPKIKALVRKKDYSGLFDLYMQNGLSCFALDLAEKQLPEKRDEVMKKFPNLEERLATAAK